MCFSPPTLHLVLLMPLLHVLGCRNDNIGSFLWSLRKLNHFPDHPLPPQTKLTTKKQHYQKKNISSRQKDEKTNLKKKKAPVSEYFLWNRDPHQQVSLEELPAPDITSPPLLCCVGSLLDPQLPPDCSNTRQCWRSYTLHCWKAKMRAQCDIEPGKRVGRGDGEQGGLVCRCFSPTNSVLIRNKLIFSKLSVFCPWW